MRIIGGRDYYDSALAHGRDEDLVFKRQGFKPASLSFAPNQFKAYQPKELAEPRMCVYFADLNGSAFVHNSSFHTDGGRVYLDPITVWFCGRRHGGIRWRFSADWTPKFRPPEPGDDAVHWSLESLLAALENAGVAVRPNTRRGAPAEDSGMMALRRHFETTERPGAYDWLVLNRIAVAVLDASRAGWGWLVNADVLKTVEFQKKVTAWEAMQELSMFVGGVLPKEGAPMVEITDQTVKIAKHGFDKYSFRKQPASVAAKTGAARREEKTSR